MSSLADDLQETLIAYLDGELDAEATRGFEERLAQDPVLRRELQLQQRSWDMLDRLPRSSVDEKFTRTTVGMIVVAAAGDLQELQAGEPVQRRRRWAMSLAGMAMAGALGYFILAAIATDRNEPLVPNFPGL